VPPGPARRSGKLSFKEQREYDGIEAAILSAEERKGALEATLADPATYQKGGAAVAGLKADLEAATAEVERLYARWQALEAIRAGG
jgi:ATP-binding cassette subfamily F protein uup